MPYFICKSIFGEMKGSFPAILIQSSSKERWKKQMRLFSFVKFNLKGAQYSQNTEYRSHCPPPRLYLPAIIKQNAGTFATLSHTYLAVLKNVGVYVYRPITAQINEELCLVMQFIYLEKLV